MIKTNKTIYDFSQVIITAGSTYLDIDAYACCVAMAELLRLQGVNAIAYSCAPCNYSVCKSLVKAGQMVDQLPTTLNTTDVGYIVVDVSDPHFLSDSIPVDNVIEVYDHHVGFETYWTERIGSGTHIEFIGAAATLIYREWKQANLQDKMSRSTTLLLIAAILDNTLNLTSSNTTPEDIAVFQALCRKEDVTQEWCAAYFSQVQTLVEADLKNALFNDIKTVRNNAVLPAKIAQLCVWDADRILHKLSDIRTFFAGGSDTWMINIIDIQRRCSYFVCDDAYHQQKLEDVFEIQFQSGVAQTQPSYLRKEIIKKTMF